MKKLCFLVSLALGALTLSVHAAMIPAMLQNANVGENANQSAANRPDKRLQALEKEKNSLKHSFRDIPPLMAVVSGKLEDLKRTSRRSSGKRLEVANRKLSLVSQEYQLLAEHEQVQQQIAANIDAHIKLEQERLADENFNALRVPVKAYYDFDDVQELAGKMVGLKTALADAEKNKIASIDDINKRKKALLLVQEEYKNKKKQQENFSVNVKVKGEDRGLSPAQQGEILDIEVRLADLRKNLAELKVTEAERKLSFTEDLLALDTAQLAILKKEYSRVQRAARIGTAYVKQMEEQLEAQRQQFVSKSDRLNDKMRLILAADIEVKNKIQDAQHKFDISAADLAAIRLLNKDPQTLREWNSFVIMLNLLTEEALLEVEREYLATQMDLEKAQFSKDELEVSIVRSWHKMTSDYTGFNTDEEVEQEIKMYRLNKVELEAQIVMLTNARDLAINSLQQLNNSLERLKVLVKLLTSQQNTIFKDERNGYEYVARFLYDVEDKVRRRINWVAKLIEAYSTNIVAVQNNVKKIDSIVEELRAKSFWRRSDQSIRWNKLQNVFPDLERFVRDIRRSSLTLVSQERASRVMSSISQLVHDPLKILLMVINIIIMIISFFLLRLYLPDLVVYLQQVGQGYPFIRSFSMLFSLSLHFILQHFKSFYSWVLLCVILNMGFIRDNLLLQLFYLLSIPYLLFLAHDFFLYLQTVNRQKNFQLVSERYQEWLAKIVPPFIYAAIILIALRESFLLGGYRSSQVPTVLLAILFILLQTLVILLLRKDQILGVLPSDTPLWEWIHEHVSYYYYPLLAVVIGIIVMSNPYVGYGRQVLYIISRVLLTVALLPFFSWIHNRIKRASVDLFFYYTDTDEVKERFMAGRFLYGLFVISSLLIFVIAGLYLGAKIWGSGITLRDLAGWFDYTLYTQFDEKGNDISVRVSTISNIFLFVIGGIALAAFVNRFVLRRALDPFFVEPGVQSTILTLVRYGIIITAIFMGLNMAHLEGLTTKLAILIAGVGFAAQEAVRDFFAYFIILVQRPIKVGDLIEVIDASRPGNPLIGVVRHITPRTIMLRQRNSVTAIIPNSRIIMNSIINWSYSRSFIAFDDMFVTIPFKADPTMVRALILQVMDANPYILKSPAPVVRLQEFVENGYLFLVRGYITSDKVLDQWDIASDFRLELVRQLKAQGIEVATPVRTIRMDQGTELK